MTLKEAVGVRGCYYDAKTGEDLTCIDLWRRMIDYLGGLDAVIPFIPFTLEELRTAYEADKHFNNLPLRIWDYAAGFHTRTYKDQQTCELVGSGIWHLYQRHGINAASCSDGVCILKEAARMWVERR